MEGILKCKDFIYFKCQFIIDNVKIAKTESNVCG